jgi:hypothetical protein
MPLLSITNLKSLKTEAKIPPTYQITRFEAYFLLCLLWGSGDKAPYILNLDIGGE